jgi:hypothetical protein
MGYQKNRLSILISNVYLTLVKSETKKGLPKKPIFLGFLFKTFFG